MSAPKVLFRTTGAFAVFTLAAWLLGIWTGDTRWVDTCKALASIGGVCAFAGVLMAIAEGEL